MERATGAVSCLGCLRELFWLEKRGEWAHKTDWQAHKDLNLFEGILKENDSNLSFYSTSSIRQRRFEMPAAGYELSKTSLVDT